MLKARFGSRQNSISTIFSLIQSYLTNFRQGCNLRIMISQERFYEDKIFVFNASQGRLIGY